MIGYLKNAFQVFLNYRFLLMNLVSRDLKVKYRRSVLGMVWSVLNPLLMSTVMALVFGTLFSRMADASQLPLVAATGEPPAFIVYVLTGQLIFAFFSESTNTAMDSVLGNAQLIKKVYIPKYIFPLEKVMFSFINTLFAMISLVIILLFTWSSISIWVLLAPVVLLLLFTFCLGMGLVLSALVVFFRDIKHLYSVLVMALTYMTPIFYSESIFDNYSLVTYVVKLNPMYWYVGMFRDVVVYGTAPEPRMWIATIACSVVALVAGLIIFRKTQDEFILHI